MTAQEYLNAFHIYLMENPHLADKPIVYASDDEGNEYNQVNNFPSSIHINNFTNRYIEVLYNNEESKGSTKENEYLIIN